MYTGAKSNLRGRVLGEVGKDSSITLPGKGGHRRLLPQKMMCPNPGEFGDRFYHSGSREQDCTPFISSGWSSNIFFEVVVGVGELGRENASETEKLEGWRNRLLT